MRGCSKNLQLQKPSSIVAMNNNFLDFVLVAAPRSGTTWLGTALAEHPRIWVPPNKEVNFFNEPYLSHVEFKYERGIEYYKGIFERAPSGAIRGELTPTYYVDLKSSERIHEHFPKTKILILLRNPADVVHSTFLKTREHYATSEDLEGEINSRPELLKLGYYYRNLKPYFDRFPRQRIYIGIYEEFFANLAENISTVYQFLGADHDFRPSALDKKINPTRSVRWPILVKMRHVLQRQANKPSLLPMKRLLTRAVSLEMLDMKLTELNLEHGHLPELDPSTRSWLMDLFAEDLGKFEELVNFNLSIWRH